MMLPIQIDTDETQGKNIQVAQEYADIHAFMKVRCQSRVIHFRLSEQFKYSTLNRYPTVPVTLTLNINFKVQFIRLVKEIEGNFKLESKISHSSEIGKEST